MSATTGDRMESEASTSTSTSFTSSSSVEWSQPCRHFEFSEILLATKNFDESLVIGSGGFGKVYKGNVINGSDLVVVAIKRLDSKSNQGAVEFWAEVEMLSKLRHCNLVSLIGYCNYEREMILVYEYMPNGTLADHLHKLHTPISWIQRLNICIGAGRGLHYLHTGTGIESGVIHRDFKSSNILLHETWAAKISDFGLSRIGPTNQQSTYVNTLVKGTFGYVDPNYFATGILTRKSDVYAFGVVLFEVLCRKRAVDRSLDDEQWSLATWVQESIKDVNLKHIIDSDIRDEISPRCLKQFVRIAERCLQSNPKQRPTMAEVLFSLESLLTLQDKMIMPLEAAGKTIFDKMIHMISFSYNGRNSDERESTLPTNSFKSATTNCSPSPSLKVFTFDDLKSATRKFSVELGEGGFGKVFLGWVDPRTLSPTKRGVGMVVAVKRLNEESTQQRYSEWEVEVNILGHLAHPNIITLLGFCIHKHERLLVYEYMPNKSFDLLLFTNARKIAKRISWETRLKIMKGVACGLIYLHSSKLICRTLKCADILLDEDFNAKLGDFGLVKSGLEVGETHVSTRVIGSHGYTDPMYMETGHLTEKSDIYAFGVVLLECLTGRRALDTKRPVNEHYLVQWAKPMLTNKGTIKKLIDPRLGKKYSLEGASKCAALVLNCLERSPKNRPSTKEVLESLEDIYSVK